MKFNHSILLSLCILAVHAQDDVSSESTSEPIPTDLPVPDDYCLEGATDDLFYSIDCENLNGKFYDRIIGYPECDMDFVCFLPPEKPEEINSSCIYISGKPYCKADISTIRECQSQDDEYNFKACIEKAKDIVEGFEYETNPPVSTIPVETTTTTTNAVTTSSPISTPTTKPRKCIVRNKN